MTGSRHEPNSAATSATYATDPCLTKAVVDGEPKVGWPKRHDPQASAAAREHGLALNAAAMVHLIRGDLRDALAEHNGTFDVVVSNPPYIPAEAIPNEPEVALHDPPEALYGGGADGMELPTAAATSAARLLVPGGYFVMEHAEVQSEWIAAMLNRTGVFAEVTTHRDLNGKDRATSAVLAPSGPTPANNRVTSDERIGQ